MCVIVECSGTFLQGLLLYFYYKYIISNRKIILFIGLLIVYEVSMWSDTRIKFILKLVYSWPYELSNFTLIIWFTIFYFSVGWLFVYCCSGLFPGGRRAEAPRSAMHSPAPGHGPVLRPPTPETARTAPATVSTTLLTTYSTLHNSQIMSVL